MSPEKTSEERRWERERENERAKARKKMETPPEVLNDESKD